MAKNLKPISPVVDSSEMRVSIANGRIIIDAPMEKTPTLSQSGKTLVVCSSHGNKATGVNYEGFPLVIGLNVYYKHRS